MNTVGRFVACVAMAIAPAMAEAAGRAVGDSGVTFTRDIAPLLFDHCGQCHHPDGSAPFSLLTYDAVRQRARLIAAVTARRQMPPWKVEPGSGDFVGQSPLLDDQIRLIERWVASGAPEGDPRDLPPTPAWPAGWQLGVPDLVVSLPAPFVVQAEGRDYSRTFVLPLPVTGVRYVKGLEFRPGNTAAVHHANIRVTAFKGPGGATDRSRGPGMQLFQATYPDGYFLGWTPGQTAPLLPEGLAWLLEPGTALVVEVHFVPTGKPEVVQPSVGFFFGADPPARTPAMLRLSRQDIDIPPGETTYLVTDSFVLPVDVEVLALQPHAHYRAHDVRGIATLPDGTETTLIAIGDWDFNWQHVYRYVTPRRLPKGTTLAMRYTYDNSADNPRNPQQPPMRARWGQQSTDEMGALWIQMLTRTDQDLHRLTAAIRPKQIAEDVIGYETMIRADPSNVSLRNDVAMMYDELGRFTDAAAHFARVVELQPQSAAAHYNLGTALARGGRLTEAAAHYQQSLALEPDYALAHNNLGEIWARLDRRVDAAAEYQEAARLNPRLADARYNLGVLALRDGNTAAALEYLGDALRLQPDWVQVLGSLAWTLATAPDDALRSPAQATDLAERAAALTDRADAEILDVLAAAQASAGRFDLAVITCDAALMLNPPKPHAAAIRDRQARYRQRQPFVLNADAP